MKLCLREPCWITPVCIQQSNILPLTSFLYFASSFLDPPVLDINRLMAGPGLTAGPITLRGLARLETGDMRPHMRPGMLGTPHTTMETNKGTEKNYYSKLTLVVLVTTLYVIVSWGLRRKSVSRWKHCEDNNCSSDWSRITKYYHITLQ